jgi:predicted esterase
MLQPTAAQAGQSGSAAVTVTTSATAGKGAPDQAGAAAGNAAGASGAVSQSTAGASGSPLDSAAAGAGSSASTTEPTPPKEFLPAASGPCPELQNGYVMFTPDGMQRRVLLYMSDAAKDKHGPLIFSWHSTLPNPEDATSWLGRSVIEEIKAQGGIVAAPATGYPNETRPWDNTPMGAQGVDGDQRLMDEIVACAHEKVGIDLRRIHATGMSAGGLKSAQVSLRRSGYIASVVVYSGGLTEGDMPPDQDPNNKLAAMILYGGPTDISPVDGINYTDASERYRDLLRSKGRLAFLCNHGGGHSVPSDSQASAWKFMQDHPYGVTPDPYATALPDGFLRYCSLTP